MGRVFYAKDTIFDAFVRELLKLHINLLLALHLVYPRFLFNKFSGVYVQQGCGNAPNRWVLDIGTLDPWRAREVQGNSVGKKGSPECGDLFIQVCCRTEDVAGRIPPNAESLFDGRGKETQDERRIVGGERRHSLLTDLCLAMRSNPLGMIRGLGEVVTCIYGPALTYVFPNPLVVAYRHSVVQVSLISVLYETTLNWCRQEDLRARMSETMLFREVKDPELMVFNFRGQLLCRMGGKREGPIEVYPKFSNLNAVAGDRKEVLRITAWKGSFEFVKKDLETILERDLLPVAVPEFPAVRRMTLGMNSHMVVPSLHARASVEKQQKEFTEGWDHLFVGCTAAVYFHTCDIKINSWNTQAKKMRGSMPPKFEVRDISRTLGEAGLENKLPIYDDGRMIVQEGHITLKDDIKFATRKYQAPHGLEELELRQEGKTVDAASPLYVALTENKKLDPSTPSPLSVGTLGDKISHPVENRFRNAPEKEHAGSGEDESMDETLSEAGEEMEVGNTPDQDQAERDFTMHELLQDLSGDDGANTATPTLGFPRKDMEVPLASEASNMGMIPLSAEKSNKNAFDGNK